MLTPKLMLSTDSIKKDTLNNSESCYNIQNFVSVSCEDKSFRMITASVVYCCRSETSLRQSFEYKLRPYSLSP